MSRPDQTLPGEDEAVTGPNAPARPGDTVVGDDLAVGDAPVEATQQRPPLTESPTMVPPAALPPVARRPTLDGAVPKQPLPTSLVPANPSASKDLLEPPTSMFPANPGAPEPKKRPTQELSAAAPPVPPAALDARRRASLPETPVVAPPPLPPPPAAGPAATVLGDADPDTTSRRVPSLEDVREGAPQESTRLRPMLTGSTQPLEPVDTAAEPTRERVALHAPQDPAPEHPPADPGMPWWAAALMGGIVLAGIGAWALVNVDAEPVKTESRRPAPPPPPQLTPREPPKPVDTPRERPPQVVMPSKPPPPGVVKVSSEPPARVIFDGHDYGPQPVTLKLPAGRNTLLLQNDELQLKRVVIIEVKPASEAEEHFTFSKGWLRVAAPRQAKLTLDGRPLKGDRPVEVWEGNHRVDIIHADKAATHDSQVAVVVAGQTTGIYFEPPRERSHGR